MIHPARTWETWTSMRSRNLRDLEAARRLTERRCCVALDPSKGTRDFLDCEDALLDDTASVFGLSRLQVERAAIDGHVQWGPQQ